MLWSGVPLARPCARTAPLFCMVRMHTGHVRMRLPTLHPQARGGWPRSDGLARGRSRRRRRHDRHRQCRRAHRLPRLGVLGGMHEPARAAQADEGQHGPAGA